jgi:hypothetical protein
VGTLAWHAARQVAAHAAPDLTLAAATLGPGTHFYTVRIGGRQVGVAMVAVDTAPDGFRVVERTDLLLPVGDSGRRVLELTEARLSRDLGLREFSASSSGDGPADGAAGWVDAQGRVGLVRAGSNDTLGLAADAPLLASVLPFRVIFGGRLELGEILDLTIVDAQLLDARRVRALVSAESTLVVPDSAAFDSAADRWVPASLDTVPVWLLDFMNADAPVHAWVDGQGFVVRAWGGAGFEYERSAFELVEREWRDAVRRGELPQLTLPAGGVAREPPMLARLAVAFDTSGWDQTDVLGSAASRGRQRLAGDSLVVEREAPTPAPWRLGDAPTPELRALLGSEPLVPSTAPRIVEIARTVAADERDPRVVAERLARWVSREVAADRAAQVPDALVALERRRGDTDSRALLFVALARAAGIPARLVSGVAATPAGWRYHTWAEVFLNGWVSADPSFGRLPASAANLRLRIGAFGRPADLAGLAVRLGPIPPHTSTR